MRRTITLILMLTGPAMVAESVVVPIEAHADHNPGPCDTHWRYENLDRVRDAVRQIIRCGARRWDVGGFDRALDVATCESGLDPWADSGINEGVYQHDRRYWPGRADRYLRPRWSIGHSPFNARGNVLVTMRMVQAGGWDPWRCA